MRVNIKYTKEDSFFCEITPEVAKEWLETSLGNRNIKKGEISKYKHEMKTGKWLTNGESICFDRNGVLRNGHHRLEAVLASGATIRSNVVVGLDPDACTVYDRGSLRSVADELRMNTDIPKCVSARNGTALIMALNDASPITYVYDSRDNVPDSAITDFAIKNYAELERVIKICDNAAVRKKTCVGVMRSAYAMAAIYDAIQSGVDPEVTKRFCDVVSSGIPKSEKENAALHLRNAYITKEFDGNSKTVRRLLYQYTMKAITDFNKGFPRAVGYRFRETIQFSKDKSEYDPRKTEKMHD